jgi:hypothetical protein
MHVFRGRLLILALLLLVPASLSADTRVQLAPKFSVGQVLRYRIDFTSKSTGKTTSPIVNPEGGSQSDDDIHMQVRLEVLAVNPGGKIRLRAVYEKSSAESETDALDLTASSFAARYNRLEGRTFEFTFAPMGDLTDVQDMTAAVSGGAIKPVTPELAWLQSLASGGNLPKAGVAIGGRWKSEKPVPGAVLAGLLASSESTYLRDEPCGPAPDSPAASANAQPASPAAECAVILTHTEISRSGSPHSDATPDDYRRNGLRTSGTWTGTGESLDTISLATGLLVSSTQSSSQNMDYQITSATTGSTFRRTGKTESQTQITLVPAE